MKKQLGQFYTSNHEHILQGLFIPIENQNIIEPFVGKGDLLEYIKCFPHVKNIEIYDIDPKIELTIKRDTLLNPPNYTNKFIVTNPPYLARNKNNDKTLYDKYDTNDLYKCFILELCTNICNGGVLIVPTNFWCSIRICDCKIRENFLSIYDIIRINMFEERVFDDTSYAICSFQFVKKITPLDYKHIPIYIFSSSQKTDDILKLNIKLSKKNNFIIGGEIYEKKSNKYKITRLTKKNKDSPYITNIVAKCIDDSTSNMISLKMSDTLYLDETENSSCRTYASLVIDENGVAINKETQKLLVEEFNIYFNKKRVKYHSLFLTNYRENSDMARKRISFDLLYNLVGYVLENYVKN